MLQQPTLKLINKKGDVLKSELSPFYRIVIKIYVLPELTVPYKT